MYQRHSKMEWITFLAIGNMKYRRGIEDVAYSIILRGLTEMSPLCMSDQAVASSSYCQTQDAKLLHILLNSYMSTVFSISIVRFKHRDIDIFFIFF